MDLTSLYKVTIKYCTCKKGQLVKFSSTTQRNGEGYAVNIILKCTILKAKFEGMEGNREKINKNKTFFKNLPSVEVHLKQTLGQFAAYTVYSYLLHVLPMIYCSRPVY